VAVIYHSHVDAGAYFSETDRRQALVGGEPAYPNAVYVVTSVVAGASTPWPRSGGTAATLRPCRFRASPSAETKP
jgi:proteasome lid subunit RPN8/RPN11